MRRSGEYGKKKSKQRGSADMAQKCTDRHKGVEGHESRRAREGEAQRRIYRMGL